MSSSHLTGQAAELPRPRGPLPDLAVSLTQLAQGKLTCLRFPTFLAPQAASQLAAQLLVCKQRTHYAQAPQVGKVGAAFFDAGNDAQRRRQYHRQAASNQRLLAKACAGQPSPLELVLAWLKAGLASGVRAETLDGQPMSAGLFRILEVGAHIGPHQDSLQADAPAALSPKKMLGQIALNLYLQMPAAGGELLIWRQSFEPADYARRQLSGSPDINPALLQAPDFVLTPQPGELILFNSSWVHAVAPVAKGERITFSLFLGYYGDDQPWTIWN